MRVWSLFEKFGFSFFLNFVDLVSFGVLVCHIGLVSVANKFSGIVWVG